MARRTWLIGAFAVIACAQTLAYYLYLRDDPGNYNGAGAQGDQVAYIDLAQQILHGTWQGAVHYMPGLPAIIAASQLAFGDPRLGIAMVQGLLFALLVVYAAHLATQAFGDPAGPWAAAAVALNPALGYYAAQALTEFLTGAVLLLLVGGVWSWSRAPSLARAIFIGALIGLLAYLRAEYLALAPVFAVLMWWLGAHSTAAQPSVLVENYESAAQPAGVPTSSASKAQPAGVPTSSASKAQPAGIPTSGASKAQPAGVPASGASMAQPAGIPASGGGAAQPAGIPASGGGAAQPAGISKGRSPFDPRREPEPQRERAKRSGTAVKAQALAMLIATALVLSPWVLRYAVTTGAPALYNESPFSNLVLMGTWFRVFDEQTFTQLQQLESAPGPREQAIAQAASVGPRPELSQRYMEQARGPYERPLAETLALAAGNVQLNLRQYLVNHLVEAPILIWAGRTPLRQSDTPHLPATGRYVLWAAELALLALSLWQATRALHNSDTRGLAASFLLVVAFLTLVHIVIAVDERFTTPALPLIGLFAGGRLAELVRGRQTAAVRFAA
jgi:hypothetical protein